MPHDPISTAIRFNDRINARDLDALVALMTEDHRFIDSAGHRTDGREPVRKAWETFFHSYPDYRNVFSQVIVQQDLVILLGRSHCSEPALDGPAIWTACVVNDRIAEWRVWHDSPQTRQTLGLPQR